MRFKNSSNASIKRCVSFADGNEVNSLNCTDQNHNSLQNMNYNCRTNGKPGGRDIRKIHTGAITTDIVTKIIISNDATKKIGDLDYQAKNDNDSKGPIKVSSRCYDEIRCF